MFDKIKDVLGGKGGGDLGDLSLGGFEKYLDGVTYPIGVDDLMTALKNNGAPEKVQGALQSASAGGKHSFTNQDDVIGSLKNQLGGMV